MIPLSHVRLAAFAHAHDRPGASLATPWCLLLSVCMSTRDGRSEVVVERVTATPAAVRLWLGY